MAWALSVPAAAQTGETQSENSGSTSTVSNDPFANPLLNNGYLPPFFSAGQEPQRLFSIPVLPDLQRAIPTQGLPIFPQDLLNYQGPSSIRRDGELNLVPPRGVALTPLLAPAPLVVRRNDWPEVIRLQLGALDPEDPSRGFAPDRAVFVSSGGRAWVTLGENPPVPKDWHNKVAVLFAGDAVETRTRGRYQMVFQDGSLMRVQGPSRFRFEALGEDARRLDFQRINRLQWFGTNRSCTLVLPDRTEIYIGEGEEGDPGCDLMLEANLGLLWVLNRGPRTAMIRTPFGDRSLPRGQRVAVLPQDPGGQPASGPLVVEGALRVARDGRVLKATGGPGGGALLWSGVRIPVGAGVSISLDPLAGSAFPEGASMLPATTGNPPGDAPSDPSSAAGGF